MAITFDLAPKDYVAMLAKISHNSPAFQTLKRFTSTGTDFKISCTPAEGELFLVVARQHCPEAVAAIEEAVKIQDLSV
jgi:hypothetical protein